MASVAQRWTQSDQPSTCAAACYTLASGLESLHHFARISNTVPKDRLRNAGFRFGRRDSGVSTIVYVASVQSSSSKAAAGGDHQHYEVIIARAARCFCVTYVTSSLVATETTQSTVLCPPDLTDHHIIRRQAIRRITVVRRALHVTAMSDKPITLYTAGTPNGWKVCYSLCNSPASSTASSAVSSDQHLLLF